MLPCGRRFGLGDAHRLLGQGVAGHGRLGLQRLLRVSLGVQVLPELLTGQSTVVPETETAAAEDFRTER